MIPAWCKREDSLPDDGPVVVDDLLPLLALLLLVVLDCLWGGGFLDALFVPFVPLTATDTAADSAAVVVVTASEDIEAEFELGSDFILDRVAEMTAWIS